MDYHKAFAQVIENRCIVLTALARQADCYPRQIRRMMDGEGTVTVPTMIALLDAMEVLSPGAKYEFFSLWAIDARSDLDRAIAAICRAKTLDDDQRLVLTRALVRHHQQIAV